ncbi:tyrosine-protein phosphatase [Rhodomicrobium lacus]|uniref:tyrosine-protein phosphatase n=1 Tax=Rhodomicrobium lacus TaxID=2498452 RepID=UPI0026E48B9E|nr:CpsB/CapC family capsule biosynthesis tyrosine phosphatase [Rhodomicrobium lacus]WKW51034.1 capsular biosynthesis protein [Rhodomicrobium lacus]
MFDLHSHLLPGIDDGSPNMKVSFDMARAYVDQGVLCVACTPHITPGLYHNTGPQIRKSAAALQHALDEAGIPLHIATGADNHIVPDFVDALRRGHLLALDDTAYVLVEPPHHTAPARLEELFFSILVAGYVPILTHPERLSWIEGKYDVIERLSARGVWMQVTAGSLLGRFGRRPRYWAQRMLEEGRVHILATDAHNYDSRPPDLLQGREAAAKIVGEAEAYHLVVTRPLGVLKNLRAGGLPEPEGITSENIHGDQGSVRISGSDDGRGLRRRVWRLFAQ